MRTELDEDQESANDNEASVSNGVSRVECDQQVCGNCQLLDYIFYTVHS